MLWSFPRQRSGIGRVPPPSKPRSQEGFLVTWALKFGEFGSFATWTLQRLVTVTIDQAACLRITSKVTSTSMTWSSLHSSTAAVSSPALVEAALFSAATSGVASAGGSAASSTCHTKFHGDGALKLAGLPRTNGFPLDAFTANPGFMQSACTHDGQVNDHLNEISDIKAAANSAGVDVRLSSAVIMQETIGCVRARTTPNDTPNTSLM